MKELMKSLSDFQAECPVIHKGTKGYGYSYADLPAIFKVINPILKKHDLGFTQLMEGTGIRTVIFHTKTGQQLESYAEIPQDVQLKGMNQFQVMGSAITYYRRYALSSALGLVTDKDVDASGEQVSAPTVVKKQKLTPTIKKAMIKAVKDGQREAVVSKLANYEVSDADKAEILA